MPKMTNYRIGYDVVLPNGRGWHETKDVAASSFSAAKNKLKAKLPKGRKYRSFYLVARQFMSPQGPYWRK